jgi:hypothetical protein
VSATEPELSAESVAPWIDKLNRCGTQLVKEQRLADDLAEALFRLRKLGDPELADRALAAYEAARFDGQDA